MSTSAHNVIVKLVSLYRLRDREAVTSDVLSDTLVLALPQFARLPILKNRSITPPACSAVREEACVRFGTWPCWWS